MNCPILGCDSIIPADMAMCREHWFMVPRALRAEIRAAWRGVLAGRGDNLERHAIAKTEAIRIVNKNRTDV